MSLFHGNFISAHDHGRANNQALSGTVLNAKGEPQSRKVMLMLEKNFNPGNLAPPNYQQLFVSRSNLAGRWTFKHLYPGRYSVITYDPTGEYDPVIKGGLIPEPME